MPAEDTRIARAIAEAKTSIGQAYESHSINAFHKALDDAYSSVEETPVPDQEWAEVRWLFVRYLDMFKHPKEGEMSSEEEREIESRRDAANEAYKRLIRARLQVRLSNQTPTRSEGNGR